MVNGKDFFLIPLNTIISGKIMKKDDSKKY
jgi:hypothetical protein